ncbi:MAG: diacylglycerol kinase family lipid kinase [Nitrospiraceae bacterium]|nr:diacylglycerol kinase family lipid kinase [Nitrospiraceae bacterium]
MNACIIWNPASLRGSQKKVALAVRLLEEAGIKTQPIQTAHKGHGIELAKKAAQEGVDIVIAAGGDGTFNEVANGLAGSGVAMAIIPMGTTNVLAKELHIPKDVEGAVKLVINRMEKGRAKPVYLGHLGFENGLQRKFLLMAGVGFDGEAVYRVATAAKGSPGKIGYIMGGLKLLAGWKPGRLSLKIDGGREIAASSVIVCKAARYGGYMKAAPEADISSPYLYAVAVCGFGKLDILRFALGFLAGAHTTMKGVLYTRCSSIQISGTPHVQADGDYIGKGPLSIEIAKDHLMMVY